MPLPPDILDFLQTCTGRELPPAAIDLMNSFRSDLENANREMNLTRIRGTDEFWIKHICDSLIIGIVCPDILHQPLQLVDIGCGAGFPLIPLAWANPQLQATGIEATSKKSAFIARAIEQLPLPNCHVVAAQAREAARQPDLTARFNILTARAVATTAKLIREARSFLNPHDPQAKMVFYKTPQAIADELPEAEREARKFGFQIELSTILELPRQAGLRQFIFVRRQ